MYGGVREKLEGGVRAKTIYPAEIGDEGLGAGVGVAVVSRLDGRTEPFCSNTHSFIFLFFCMVVGGANSDWNVIGLR